MALIVWPADAVTGAPSYTGEKLRQTVNALWTAGTNRPIGAIGGIHPATPTTFASATSTTWTITPHKGVLDLETSSIAGPYVYCVTANVTGSVTAADATNPRLDIIYVQLSDPAEGDGTVNPGIAILYLAGTPAASPVVPTLPARSMALAVISVPKVGGGSPVTVLSAYYSVAAGGVTPTQSSAWYPPSPAEGQYADDAALNALMRYDGAAWVAVATADPADTITFTPGGNTDTSAAGGTQTWVTLGNITVPAWATKAAVSWSVNGFFENGASGSTTVAVSVGSSIGTFKRILGAGSAGSVRYGFNLHDSLTGLSAGSQSVTIRSTFTSGGTYRVDTLSAISALFIWKP